MLKEYKCLQVIKGKGKLSNLYSGLVFSNKRACVQPDKSKDKNEELKLETEKKTIAKKYLFSNVKISMDLSSTSLGSLTLSIFLKLGNRLGES